jgi:DnaJ family protein C protein 9
VPLVQTIPGSHYEVLGISTAASQKEVQSAYRRQATKWHPDKWATAGQQAQGKAANQFQQIQIAHEVLADPTERARYDTTLTA